MTNNWEDPRYQKIVDVKNLGNSLQVDFENGDQVKIELGNLLPFESQKLFPENLRFDYYEIIIPGETNEVAVPWDKVRVISDASFSKYLAERAENHARSVGNKIKTLREKVGMKGFELAERAGVTPQTITRIERGHTDVGFGTLRKILAAMGFSLLDLANQDASEVQTEKSMDFLVKKMRKAGIEYSFLYDRIVPVRLRQTLSTIKGEQPSMLLDEIASYVSGVYGWPIEEIWSEKDLSIDEKAASFAFFKKPASSNYNQVKAYSHYAHYLSKTVLKACNDVKQKEYPGDIDEFKELLIAKYATVSISSLLQFTWDLGICVIPLNDSGIFHGASWNIEGRHVIVLKQRTKSHAKWLFDLLHEIYHVFAHLDNRDSAVIESEEISPFSSNDSVEESEANSFANQVLFDSKAEVLADKCIAEARYNIQNLKKAVTKVAEEEKVNIDNLSNYIAYRLMYQGENWWSTANSLQVTSPDPYEIAIKHLKDRLDLKILNPVEHNVLLMAIN